MKLLFVALVTLISLNVFAQDERPTMENVKLWYTQTNGTVAPEYQQTKNCVIDGVRVAKFVSAKNIRPEIFYSEIRWTKEIASAGAMAGYLSDAALGTVVTEEGPIPPGAGITSYSGSYAVSNSNKTVEVTLLISYQKYNNSKSARDLVEFLNENCVK
jgi:hypothetical protein